AVPRRPSAPRRARQGARTWSVSYLSTPEDKPGGGTAQCTPTRWNVQSFAGIWKVGGEAAGTEQTGTTAARRDKIPLMTTGTEGDYDERIDPGVSCETSRGHREGLGGERAQPSSERLAQSGGHVPRQRLHARRG